MKLVKGCVDLVGFGHALGKVTESNQNVAKRFGLLPNWYEKRTGIATRRVSGPQEDVLSLASAAVTDALREAGLNPGNLGPETVVIHIQNGLTHLTPPAAIVLAGQLGMHNVRVMGLDGVCAEPIAAIDHALLMLASGRCKRAIISASVDFLSYLDPLDRDIAGLFGSGSGAMILSTPYRRGASNEHGKRIALNVRALEWETHAAHWSMGEARVRRIDRDDGGVRLLSTFYTMRGQSLYRMFLNYVPSLLQRTLKEAGWAPSDVDLVISHQPNPRMLELALHRLGFSPDVVPMPGRTLGNMGPASLLVNLSMAEKSGVLVRGSKVLLLAFGLGFSCGALAVEVQP